jgi:hypothetical protein
MDRLSFSKLDSDLDLHSIKKLDPDPDLPKTGSNYFFGVL